MCICSLYFFPSPLCRNILTLTNAFDLPENYVTQDNFTALQAYYNETDPTTFARLDFQTCDLNALLSDVRRRYEKSVTYFYTLVKQWQNCATGLYYHRNSKKERKCEGHADVLHNVLIMLIFLQF